MKKMKKLISVLLTLVMVIAMAAPAFASDAGTPPTPPTKKGDYEYTITIETDKPGHFYEAYQIFQGDLAADGMVDGEEKLILSNIEWGYGISDTEGLVKTLKEEFPDALGEIEDCTASDVAKALEGGKIQAAAFADVVNGYLGSASRTLEPETGAGVINYHAAVRPGYYLIKDRNDSLDGTEGDAYTKFMLQMVGDVTVKPKTDAPEVTKKVKENVKYTEENGYNDVADYNIGDSVPFAFYSTVPDMTYYEEYQYVFEDTMSEGLTLDTTSVTVTIGGEKLQMGRDFHIVTNTGDGVTFRIVIPDLKGYDAGKDIVVNFNATLNENAKIGAEVGNPNKVQLSYSNNPNDKDSRGKTPEDTVIVFTYELDVTKVDGQTPDLKLQGAEFKLYRIKGEGTEGETREYAKVTDGKIAGWTEDPNEASVLTSDGNGLFKVAGLDDGIYYLEETKAPAGYNLLKDAIKLTISASTKNDEEWAGVNPSEAFETENPLTITIDEGNPEAGNLSTGVVETTVVNNKGAALPETGGIGTTIFYIVGAILVIGAGVVLVTRKKMSHHE